jgi:hypothetical protein
MLLENPVKTVPLLEVFGDLLQLAVEAGPDPEPQRDARRFGKRLREDPKATWTILPPYVRVGH